MSSSGQTRQRLLREATKLFLKKGYARTTIADIERAAGLAPRTGGFYRHFAGKAELAAEIGATSFIETGRDLGFDGVLPLGDTRAELVLIAKGYLKAADRQAGAERLMQEVRDLPAIRKVVNRADRELLALLLNWLRPKRHARGMSEAELVALAFSVFGGWLFYLSKRSSPAVPREVDSGLVLNLWADRWLLFLERTCLPDRRPTGLLAL